MNKGVKYILSVSILAGCSLETSEAFAYCVPGPQYNNCMKLEQQQELQRQQEQQQEQLRLQQQQQEQLRLQQQQQEQLRQQQLQQQQQQEQQRAQEQQRVQQGQQRLQQQQEQQTQRSRSGRASVGQSSTTRTTAAANVARTHVTPQRSSAGKTYSMGGQTLSSFSVKPYRWPQGHHYVRFTNGMRLAHVFRDARYIIENFADYGLSDPGPGFEWLRFGPDALLVNMQDGDVAGSAPDMFQEDSDAQDDGASGDPTLDAPGDQ